MKEKRLTKIKFEELKEGQRFYHEECIGIPEFPIYRKYNESHYLTIDQQGDKFYHNIDTWFVWVDLEDTSVVINEKLEALKKRHAELEALETQLCCDFVDEVERQVRELMDEHPELNTFVMCMGSEFFTMQKEPDEDGEVLDGEHYAHLDEFNYMRPLYDLFFYYNDRYHISGVPMKIERDKPRITDW